MFLGTTWAQNPGSNTVRMEHGPSPRGGLQSIEVTGIDLGNKSTGHSVMKVKFDVLSTHEEQRCT